jgi:hypothetical protein
MTVPDDHDARAVVERRRADALPDMERWGGAEALNKPHGVAEAAEGL